MKCKIAAFFIALSVLCASANAGVEIVRFLTRPEVKEKLFNSGLETAGGSPEQFAAVVKSELLRMSKVIKDAGIRAQ